MSSDNLTAESVEEGSSAGIVLPLRARAEMGEDNEPDMREVGMFSACEAVLLPEVGRGMGLVRGEMVEMSLPSCEAAAVPTE